MNFEINEEVIAILSIGVVIILAVIKGLGRISERVGAIQVDIATLTASISGHANTCDPDRDNAWKAIAENRRSITQVEKSLLVLGNRVDQLHTPIDHPQKESK